MDKEKYLEDNLKAFGKKLKIEFPLEIKMDKRLKVYIAYITLYRYTDNNELFYLLRYNPKELCKLTKAEIMYIIFHELGHVKLKHLDIPELNMNNEIDIKCEKEADNFALENIRKYIPQYYKQTLKAIKKL